MYQLDLRRAERELSFAFRNRPSLSNDEDSDRIIYTNGRLMLLYLTACRLCLGLFPSEQLLHEYDLHSYFAPLMKAIKSGDLNLLQQTLSVPIFVAWLVKKEIYFLLKEKLDVLCWRSLIRRTCLVSRSLSNPPQMRVPLDGLLDVARALTRDTSYDIFDVECITASLLDQVGATCYYCGLTVRFDMFYRVLMLNRSLSILGLHQGVYTLEEKGSCLE